jgi:hypothetical protein
MLWCWGTFSVGAVRVTVSRKKLIDCSFDSRLICTKPLQMCVSLGANKRRFLRETRYVCGAGF